MDSTLQSDVTMLQMKNYGTLVILAAVGYDYTLTFSDEIEHIWVSCSPFLTHTGHNFDTAERTSPGLGCLHYSCSLVILASVMS